MILFDGLKIILAVGFLGLPMGALAQEETEDFAPYDFEAIPPPPPIEDEPPPAEQPQSTDRDRPAAPSFSGGSMGGTADFRPDEKVRLKLVPEGEERKNRRRPPSSPKVKSSTLYQ